MFDFVSNCIKILLCSKSEVDNTLNIWVLSQINISDVVYEIYFSI